MIFNSLTFLAFFAVFFLFYWFLFHRTVLLQNVLILVASYVFYAFCDWKFLSLLFISSAVYYLLARSIDKTPSDRTKKILLYTGLIFSVGLLLWFKYYDFFIGNFYRLFSNSDQFSLTAKVIIPLGISFYTFKCIGYLLDVYNGKFKATDNAAAFFCYVSFFPTIISGPIDKAKTLLPQFESPRHFDLMSARNGMLQIVWGLFKKTVIADNCASYTDNVFADFSELPGSTLLLATFLYTIQIYADFSGYSDMAIGISRLLGFSITKNFDFPLFSVNIAEFWRRWHMSLTAWFTEYVFTPLSILFRDLGKTGLMLAIIVNFTIVGIWHGSKWTFVLFGFLHGCYYIPLILRGTMNRSKKKNTNMDFTSWTSMIFTFVVVMLTFVFFRSDSVSSGLAFLKHMFSLSLFTIPEISTKLEIMKFGWVIFFLVIEFYGRHKNYAIENIAENKPVLRWTIYYLLVISIFVFAGLGQQFIYFQF
jgi:alginate O-acetyltransferase complex protein AlgI